MILYFNPRSHERSDPVLSSVPLGSVPISIHAPTRGATETGAHQSNEFVFQSTLPREERQYSINTIRIICSISIHAPTRGATGFFNKGGLLSWISIHAPTRGATSNPCVKCVHIPYFNPRSHERSDSVIC